MRAAISSSSTYLLTQRMGVSAAVLFRIEVYQVMHCTSRQFASIHHRPDEAIRGMNTHSSPAKSVKLR